MRIILTDEKDERFLKLVEELDWGYYRRIGDELEKYREYNEFKTPHIVNLMIDGGEAIACASYRAFDEKGVEFKRVYVKKEYRKRDIASALMKEVGYELTWHTALTDLTRLLDFTNTTSGFFNGKDITVYKLDLPVKLLWRMVCTSFGIGSAWLLGGYAVFRKRDIP